MQNYAPQVYPGRITLFRAAALNTAYKELVHHPAIQEPDRGWNEFSAQPVEVYVVPGDHATVMFVPHVRELAARLTACLNQAPDVMTK
jgi:thioesterase domain-containing protein